jgi:hypothetical protein
MRKIEPKLPLIHPPCPKCRYEMLASVASAGPEGFEHYTFECSGCGHSETSSVGWPFDHPFLTEATFSVTAENKRC